MTNTTYTTTSHNVDDMTVRITRRDNHEISHITIEQGSDIVAMTKTDLRAMAELIEMADICEDCHDIVR